MNHCHVIHYEVINKNKAVISSGRVFVETKTRAQAKTIVKRDLQKTWEGTEVAISVN